MNNTHVVIMAGGVGSRLWPASTPLVPKQFIDLLGVGKTMIQLTAARFEPVCPVGNFWVVTSAMYVETVRRQLPDIPEDHILAEPEARNTAPCIAYACAKIARRYPDANVVVTPADALVLNENAFTDVMKTALDFTAHSSHIVTVGILPVRPETGYGYIRAEKPVSGEIVKVLDFREKPDRQTAEFYLSEGNYFWNAGIFVWNVRTINEQMRRHVPGIMDIMDRISPYFYTDRENEVLAELFPKCEKISVDYAVMEKSDEIYVISEDLGWSDLGSWGAVRMHMAPDCQGNAVLGQDVRMFNSSGCVVRLSSLKKAVIEGLDGYVVAENDGNLVICRLEAEQHIREYSSDKQDLRI